MVVSNGKKSLKVLNDRVLVKSDQEDVIETDNKEVTEAIKSGKIVIPETVESFYSKRPTRGRVIGWGDKCKYKWKADQVVHFARDGWAKITFDGEELMVFVERDIHAIES